MGRVAVGATPTATRPMETDEYSRLLLGARP